jgi:hypothetical protein
MYSRVLLTEGGDRTSHTVCRVANERKKRSFQRTIASKEELQTDEHRRRAYRCTVIAALNQKVARRS